MKIDAFAHIFPKRYFDKMIEVAPNEKDMSKRVRNIPSIVSLDEHIHWTIEIIDSLNITVAERHAIYEGNARRLLKLRE